MTSDALNKKPLALGRQMAYGRDMETLTTNGPRRVFLESPYAGEVAANVAYARACMADSLRRGEAPFASHLLYTQPGVLDDAIPGERAQGIEAGLAFLPDCEASVVYTDRGVSDGMAKGIARAHALGIPVEYRSLSPEIGER